MREAYEFLLEKIREKEKQDLKKATIEELNILRGYQLAVLDLGEAYKKQLKAENRYLKRKLAK